MRRRLEQLSDLLGMHLPFILPPGPVQGSPEEDLDVCASSYICCMIYMMS